MTDLNKHIPNGISVAITDNHEVVLEGFHSFLVKNGISRVETFANAQSLLDRIRSTQFSIYIVDAELPEKESPKLIEAIRSLHPDAKIIINTIHEKMWLASKMEEKDIDGVMYKSGDCEQLVKAIFTVTRGHKFYCKSYSSMHPQCETPSDREIEVLTYIAKGYSTKEIASCLFISENTVENHRRSLFRKLHVHNMVELIVKSITIGYIDLEEISKDL